MYEPDIYDAGRGNSKRRRSIGWSASLVWLRTHWEYHPRGSRAVLIIAEVVPQALGAAGKGLTGMDLITHGRTQDPGSDNEKSVGDIGHRPSRQCSDCRDGGVAVCPFRATPTQLSNLLWVLVAVSIFALFIWPPLTVGRAFVRRTVAREVRPPGEIVWPIIVLPLTYRERSTVRATDMVKGYLDVGGEALRLHSSRRVTELSGEVRTAVASVELRGQLVPMVSILTESMVIRFIPFGDRGPASIRRSREPRGGNPCSVWRGAALGRRACCFRSCW